MTFALTEGQQAFYDLYSGTIAANVPATIVLKGYAGTGKSTLVRRLVEDLPEIYRTAKILNPNIQQQRELVLTATTNKACEALAEISGEEVRTIHSTLGLVVKKDYSTGATSLGVRRSADPVQDSIVIIDEASYIDQELLQLIFKRCQNCIIVFVGDPAQLLAVKATTAPVFDLPYPTVELTEVMRQTKGNPILDLATRWRNTVLTGEFFKYRPDGIHVRHLPQDQFNLELQQEFTREDWTHSDSKVLAWTNKRVIEYNRGLRQLAKGEPVLQVGDYAINNSAINNGKFKLRTDALVYISAKSPGNEFGVAGYHMQLNHAHSVFLPVGETKSEVLKRMRKAIQPDMREISRVEDYWVDLRAAYSCTINKSQGSTYRKAYIDLNDVGRCNNLDTLARLLYVGISRAAEEVIFTGDIA